MSEQCLMPAVLLCALENRHAAWGRRVGGGRRADVTAAVDELVLVVQNTSGPCNHTRLIGVWAEPRRVAGNVLAGWFLDSIRGNHMQVDGCVRGAACKSVDYLLNRILIPARRRHQKGIE